MNGRYTFKKEERISAAKDIDLLFKAGQSFKSFPLRVLYVTKPLCNGTPKPKILISVPKKQFKHAVDRNRIKRLIREAYRLNKNNLTAAIASKDFCLQIAFIYIKKEDCIYEEIENAIKKALFIMEENLS